MVTSSLFPIRAGSEEEIIEGLVRSQVINNWEAQDEQEHLRTIRDPILSQEEMTSRLLGLYQQILQDGEVEADGSQDQMELRLSGLVVQREGKLSAYNSIYREVFSQEWVREELAKLRPYREAFSAWLKSGKQDESKLLQGEALREALGWKRGKRLSTDPPVFSVSLII